MGEVVLAYGERAKGREGFYGWACAYLAGIARFRAEIGAASRPQEAAYADAFVAAQAVITRWRVGIASQGDVFRALNDVYRAVPIVVDSEGWEVAA